MDITNPAIKKTKNKSIQRKNSRDKELQQRTVKYSSSQNKYIEMTYSDADTWRCHEDWFQCELQWFQHCNSNRVTEQTCVNNCQTATKEGWD